MPLGLKPQCVSCKSANSTMWRKNDKGEILCNNCSLKHSGVSSIDISEPSSSNNKNNGTSQSGNSILAALRKSARTRSFRNRPLINTKQTPKGKSRRVIVKKNPLKSHTAVATVVTSESVFYKGMYFQVGDIVSLMDVDGGVYYAQIRGFLQDQYCEKSVVITWLIPTQDSPKDHFDPSTYIIGPEEDLPRKIDYIDFVCHAPSEYYKSKTSPYPVNSSKGENCFVWSSIKPYIRPTPSTEEILSGAVS